MQSEMWQQPLRPGCSQYFHVIRVINSDTTWSTYSKSSRLIPAMAPGHAPHRIRPSSLMWLAVKLRLPGSSLSCTHLLKIAAYCNGIASYYSVGKSRLSRCPGLCRHLLKRLRSHEFTCYLLPIDDGLLKQKALNALLDCTRRTVIVEWMKVQWFKVRLKTD